MGYPTKIQCIKRKKSEQWYVNFPAAVAQAIEFQQGEVVEWLIDDHQRLVLNRSDQAVFPLKKKTSEKTLKEAFESLLAQCEGAFKQTRTATRAHDLAFGLLNCVGKRTVTGMLTARGQQFRDWSAAYRLFYGKRMNTDCLFSVIREELLKNHLNSLEPIYAHMDDTNIRKRGKKVAGTSWMRDPLGPPFHTNFIWGQRFIQLSVSLPNTCGASQSRAIPVDFHHCPTIRKPKKSDGQSVWDDYKEKKRKTKLSRVGCERIKRLRDSLNKSGVPGRSLIVSVDGSYTNETVLKHLPDNTTLIGRIRKDCCLNEIPGAKGKGVGRKRVYGEQLHRGRHGQYFHHAFPGSFHLIHFPG